MAKKKSGSSARGKRVVKKKGVMRRIVRKIDFSDIPELSDAQLKSMHRVGRPTIGKAARELIAIRIDPNVLFSLKQKAKKLGKGYQSLINDILGQHLKKVS